MGAVALDPERSLRGMKTMHDNEPLRDEETLDPIDWTEVERIAGGVVADAVRHLREVREVRDRPVWQELPVGVRTRFQTSLPAGPAPLADVVREVQETVMPYPMGNIHPRFWAWFMGSGSFTGALADFLAGIQGSNLGGGDHAVVHIERQVVQWCREMVGLPASTAGTLVDGGSAANLVCLTVARNAMAGVDVREQGVAALPMPELSTLVRLTISTHWQSFAPRSGCGCTSTAASVRCWRLRQITRTVSRGFTELIRWRWTDIDM